MDMTQHLRNIASSGGKATVAKYGAEQVRAWGRTGGRPKLKRKKKGKSHSGSFAKGK